MNGERGEGARRRNDTEEVRERRRERRSSGEIELEEDSEGLHPVVGGR